jgi:hypothetical protein
MMEVPAAMPMMIDVMSGLTTKEAQQPEEEKFTVLDEKMSGKETDENYGKIGGGDYGSVENTNAQKRIGRRRIREKMRKFPVGIKTYNAKWENDPILKSMYKSNMCENIY